MISNFATFAQTSTGVRIFGDMKVCPSDMRWYDFRAQSTCCYQYKRQIITITKGTIQQVIVEPQANYVLSPDRKQVTITTAGSFAFLDTQLRIQWGDYANNDLSGKATIHCSSEYNFMFWENEYSDDYHEVQIGVGKIPSVEGFSALPCNLNQTIYNIPPIDGADAYIWSVSNGATIVEGQGTTQIRVNFPPNFNSIDVAATAVSYDCPQTTNTKTVRVSRQAIVSPYINGSEVITPGYFGDYVASGDYIVGVYGSSFNWSVPNGWQIVSGQGTPSVYLQAPSTNLPGGYLTVTGVDACGRPYSASKFISTEQYQTQSKGEIKLYPNPSSDFITIEYDKGTNFDVKVFDMLGQVVNSFENVSNGFRFDVTTMKPSTYIVHIITPTEVITKQVAVKRAAN